MAVNTTSYDFGWYNRIGVKYDTFFDGQFVDVQSSVAVEYISCEATSTCLMNAIQYTLLLQLLATLLFFVVKTAIEEGPTYSNALANKSHTKREYRRPAEGSGNAGEVDLAPIEEIRMRTEPEEQQEMQPRLSFIDNLAKLLLKTTAPKSKYQMTGSYSFAFRWYFAKYLCIAVLVLYRWWLFHSSHHGSEEPRCCILSFVVLFEW